MLGSVISCALEKIQNMKLSMKNSKEQILLGVTIDNKLTFKSHLKNLCKKAS